MQVKRIHVFRSGDQTSAQGIKRSFSEKDLKEVVETYDPSIHEAPLVIGHSGDNDSLPSYGWIKGFSQDGGNLYADVAFTDNAKDLVKNGHYRKVSISFYSPESAINPYKGKWSARHLALLGASPPAVKGLEPFSFSEEEGVLDFSVTLSPSDIFDEELGPTLISETSPLEMLKQKLDEVRQDMSSSLKDLQGKQQPQPDEQLQDVGGSSVTEQPETAQMANPETSQFKEPSPNVGRKGTEITQQTADLETQFPEEEFMEKGKISRKHAKGAHGQDMQIVENVYEEQHKELPEALKEQIEKKKKGSEEGEGMDAKHSEDEDMTDTGVMKRKGGDGGPGSADHAEEAFGRNKTARNSSDGYADRMKTGEAGDGAQTGRNKTAKSSEQDRDRLNTPKSGEQEEDRKKTAKETGDEGVGEDRWAGQPDGEDQAMNADQYDAGVGDYPETSRPETASMPAETEETPDDEVFAIQTQNVMSDKNMRVLRQKSSDGRKGPKGGPVSHNFEEGESDEEIAAEHGEKVRKDRVEDTDVPAEMVGPDGAHSEARGEKKSTEKQLSGEMDRVDVPAEMVGPDGAHSEGEDKNKYTKTGYGSTYKEEHMEDEEGGKMKKAADASYSEDQEEELSADHCDMQYGGAGFNPEQMFQELQALKHKYAELERRNAEEKMMHRRQQLSSFVEALYEEGRLTDGVMPQQDLLAYCEGLEFGTLEFSEGETSATKLLNLLNNLPPMVSFDEVAGGSFQFAEQADLDPHERALKMVESGECQDYVEAIKKSMFQG